VRGTLYALWMIFQNKFINIQIAYECPSLLFKPKRKQEIPLLML